MTNERTETASDVIGRRVRETRNRRGWTAAELAERVAEAGGPEISKQQMFNIETGRPDKDGNRRRHITLEELLALAYVLDVSPLHLFVPPWGNERYHVTTTVTSNPSVMRAWIRGTTPLPGQTESVFISERPANETKVVQWNELEAADQGGRQ